MNQDEKSPIIGHYECGTDGFDVKFDVQVDPPMTVQSIKINYDGNNIYTWPAPGDATSL